MYRLILGLAGACGLLGAEARQPDVIVVGAGIAGLTTALEAARGGARVAVVDLASVFGGHAVVSEGGLALIGTPLQEESGAKDSPELAYQDFLRWGSDANEAWVKQYVDRSRRDIHDWLAGLGVKFNRLLLLNGNSVARFHVNPRRGFGLVEPIYRECLRSGRVSFHWNTRITELTEEGGWIRGVAGVNERTGKPFRMTAQAIVLATGGFQSNLELVKEHWPRELGMPGKILIGAGTNAHGSGLGLARRAGAAIERLDHQWNYPAGVPDPRSPGSNRGLNLLNPVAVWINAKGERFANESWGAGVLLKRMLEQPGGRAWVVFDANGRQPMFISGTDWADPKRVDELILNDPRLVHKADSLEQLAQLAGWPVSGFVATIGRFNRSVEEGTDASFGWFDASNPPSARPGRPAIPPVAKAPFYAVPVYPMTRKSMGGIAVDLECRVLNKRREPIPNLYAVGEVTGFNGLNGKAGLEGTFLGPSILQGRILGQRLAKPARGTGQEIPRPLAPARQRSSPAAAECASCHPMATLVGARRKGYWHFERVHEVAEKRAWECGSCHSEMAPFVAEQHRTDAVAQIAACERCHSGGQ
ncbi:MAG: FAD-dependent oxidoreductase [Bryobacteraceae bacterium]|nr:FAD-dependent oxidoreductase [Bryobacteraceae bacterium]